MRTQFVGNKPSRVAMPVVNGETSASIPRGTPVVLKLTDTADAANDGLKVVLPSTSGAARSAALKYGVLSDTLAAGALGESILHGVASYALVTRMTRAASTNSWTSSASVVSGVLLAIDTLNDAFLLGASIDGSVASAGGNAVLLDSLASSAASASATSDTRTAITNSARIFVRML